MGRKILITGATGRVALPVVQALSADHEVWAAARFSEPDLRAQVEAAGAHTFGWDMAAAGSLDGLPDDFTHVLHAGMINDYRHFEPVISATCDATGRLMAHCRRAEAFLFVSSSVVYGRLDPGHLHLETDPLGGTSTPEWGPAYAATKMSVEGTVRGVAAALGLPTTIARLSVQYGGAGGTSAGRGGMPARFHRLITTGRPVPVRPTDDDFCNPLHIDDIVRQVPLLWDAAALPVTVVNWGGDEAVSARELAHYIAGLAHTRATFVETGSAAGMVAVDPTFRTTLIGPSRVGWRDGIARLLSAR